MLPSVSRVIGSRRECRDRCRKWTHARSRQNDSREIERIRARHIGCVDGISRTPHRTHQIERLRTCKLLARKACHETAATNLPPASILRKTGRSSLHAGRRPRGEEISKQHSPSRQQLVRPLFCPFGIDSIPRDQRPSSSRVTRPGVPTAAFPTSPLRVDQCSEVFEPVRRNEACGNQLPQRIFRFTRQPFGCASRSAKKSARSLSSAASTSRAAWDSESKSSLDFFLGYQPRRIFPNSNAIGATRVARIRLPSPSSNAGCGETRAHMISPERESSSSSSGSYFATRCVRICDSHAAAGIS